MKEYKEYKTREELVAEAVELIQRAEDWQIIQALEAAMGVGQKSA